MVFYKGMLFDDTNKWWGDQGMRDKPHEGVDLCFYNDGQGGIHRLNEDMKIPAMYDGAVAGVINDFLGKSVIIEHKLPDNDQIRWCTIYWHTNPVSEVVQYAQLDWDAISARKILKLLDPLHLIDSIYLRLAGT
ncbi:MAG: hypothetical protein HY808_05120 [Nitrospirae bacterium]|nr:hypothetical protein [Nitrospirota bacterium]